jgi:hypothetical protein
MFENLQDEPTITDDPTTCILPLRADPDRKPFPLPQPFEPRPTDEELMRDVYAYDASRPLPKYQTVDSYVKSCQDQYQLQIVNPMYPTMHGESHPRSKGIQSLLAKYKIKMAGMNMGKDSIGLTRDQGHELSVLKQLMKTAWMHAYPIRRSLTASHQTGQKRISFRNRLDTCWSHFMMSRGESMRMATLGDLGTHEFEAKDAGGQICLGVILAMLHGKTNDGDKDQYGIILRNKDVEICPVGSLGFYLFDRWQVGE